MDGTGRWLTSEKQGKWVKVRPKGKAQTTINRQSMGSWPWRNPVTENREPVPQQQDHTCLLPKSSHKKGVVSSIQLWTGGSDQCN